MITEECINCDVCEPACPNQAISPGTGEGKDIYSIDPNRCTECVGHFEEPQCQLVCPVACIPHNPDYLETKEELLAKHHLLTLPSS